MLKCSVVILQLFTGYAIICVPTFKINHKEFKMREKSPRCLKRIKTAEQMKGGCSYVEVYCYDGKIFLGSSFTIYGKPSKKNNLPYGKDLGYSIKNGPGETWVFFLTDKNISSRNTMGTFNAIFPCSTKGLNFLKKLVKNVDINEYLRLFFPEELKAMCD